ncbi:MAG: UPF0175 family protein [Verrucomicrobia bacterium]|jgi:predicted HTH domain antitoxin|nr:UPF0175 family protein [Verrucomicrobiota bacterium]
MNLVLPEKVEATLKPQEARLDFAVGLYSSGRVTMGTAAEVANLSIPEFQRELGQRRIPIHYGPKDLAEDIQAAREIAGQ